MASLAKTYLLTLSYMGKLIEKASL